MGGGSSRRECSLCGNHDFAMHVKSEIERRAEADRMRDLEQKLSMSDAENNQLKVLMDWYSGLNLSGYCTNSCLKKIVL